MTDVKRSYVAPRREASARETRRVILEAAHRLFVAQGYAATTIDQIAQEAEVSRPTVFTVGPKAALLKLARDIAMAGDDEPVAIVDREAFQGIQAEPDARKTLQRFAAHVGAVARRYADLDEVLHRAAGSDSDLAELWQTSENQRAIGAQRMTSNLRTKGTLALPPERAIDVLALLMAPSLYYQLVLIRGWTHEEYVDWLALAMQQSLLA